MRYARESFCAASALPFARKHQWCLSIGVLASRIGPVLQKHVDNVTAIERCHNCQMQGRLTGIIRPVDISSCTGEYADGIDIPERTRNV